MRRVKFSCADVSPFIGGDMHVRILVPPKGRTPIWPGLRDDGRVDWPEGEDALLVRVYTIRKVDQERGELWVDFFQHPAPGVLTPGADFARDAKAGDRLAFLGPGGGDLPLAREILLVGDESALPAIARIAAEVPPDTRMRAIIEVQDEAEEQRFHRPEPGSALAASQILCRCNPDRLFDAAKAAIASVDDETFVWVACEKDDVRLIRSLLKQRGHDRRRMYVAWYWERGQG